MKRLCSFTVVYLINIITAMCAYVKSLIILCRYYYGKTHTPFFVPGVGLLSRDPQLSLECVRDMTYTRFERRPPFFRGTRGVAVQNFVAAPRVGPGAVTS